MEMIDQDYDREEGERMRRSSAFESLNQGVVAFIRLEEDLNRGIPDHILTDREKALEKMATEIRSRLIAWLSDGHISHLLRMAAEWPFNSSSRFLQLLHLEDEKGTALQSAA